MIRSTTKKLLRTTSAIGVVGALFACGESSPSLPEEGLGKRLESVTGDHTRAVWMWHQAKKSDGEYSNDTYGNGNSHFLMGIDSRDGLGARKLIAKNGNWARPMLSPDGETVVYTDKNVKRKNGSKHFSPIIYALTWGKPLSSARKIGKGHAVDVWEDPSSGIVYVYAIDNLRPTKRFAPTGKRMQRYRLDGKKGEFKYGREILFEEEIALDNFQLGRDGLTASGQFPWPNGGTVDMESGEWSKRGQGCWTSMAPDDSGVMWVFDGAHRNARMFGPQGEVSWKTPIDTHPDFMGLEVYHPRWGNHPQVIALTGPYGSNAQGGNQISKGGNEAEIFVGRFSEDLREVEEWVKLTENDTGDYYPDVWVAGGETVSLDIAKLGISERSATQAEVESIVPAKTIFRWDNAKIDNKIGKRHVTVEPAGTARFGYRFQMLLDGGSFVADGASTLEVEKLVAWGSAWSISFTLEERAAPKASAAIINLPGSTLFRTSEGIRYRDVLIPISEIGLRTYTLTILDGKLISAAIDKEQVKLDASPEIVPVRDGGKMSFGSEHEWPASYQVGISDVLLVGDVREPRKAPESSEPRPPQIRIRAKLIEKLPTPSSTERDTYIRSLVHYTYSVEEVLEGELEDKEVAVWHWVVLDDEETIGLPDMVGEVYDLTIEPAEAPYHRELDGELSTQSFTDLYLDARIPRHR